MNAKIQALLVQAQQEIRSEEEIRGLAYPDHDKEVASKFAELIVRECANRLRETDYELMFVEDGMCDPSISDAMLVAASDIEEHFGVE